MVGGCPTAAADQIHHAFIEIGGDCLTHLLDGFVILPKFVRQPSIRVGADKAIG